MSDDARKSAAAAAEIEDEIRRLDTIAVDLAMCGARVLDLKHSRFTAIELEAFTQGFTMLTAAISSLSHRQDRLMREREALTDVAMENILTKGAKGP